MTRWEPRARIQVISVIIVSMWCRGTEYSRNVGISLSWYFLGAVALMYQIALYKPRPERVSELIFHREKETSLCIFVSKEPIRIDSKVQQLELYHHEREFSVIITRQKLKHTRIYTSHRKKRLRNGIKSKSLSLSGE